MSYKEMARRLAALEAPQWADDDVLGSSQAPKAWTHLAAWALLEHDAGDGPLPDGPSPYDRMGYLWVITTFWQRGADRFLSQTNAETALDVIVACVEYLLSEGVSRGEIRSWKTGRQVWDQVWQARHASEPI